MSGSDRGGDHQAELRRWLFRAAILAAFLVGIGGIQHGIHYYDAASQAARYASDAKDKIAAECRMPATFAKCAAEINNTARANQRDEYDLYSQKAMALWTGVMGAMGIFGIALSGVGIYLLWQTWVQTGEAAQSSRKTLNSYIARERAIVRCEGAFYSFVADSQHPHGFIVKFRNVGHSAANITSVGWRFIMSPVWQKFSCTDFQPIIAPANDTNTSMHLGTSKFPSDPCWLIGTATYRTLNSETFDTHFCYKVTLVHGDLYGPDEWLAEPERCTGMPRST